MEDDQQWKERIDNILQNQRSQVSEEDLNSFLQRVDQVGSILDKLKSDDKETVKLAMAQADEMLGSKFDGVEIDEDKVKVKKDRSLINKNAFKDEEPQENMEMEAFKRTVEADAKKRAEDRRQRKEVAERYKMEGNRAFREGNYSKALDSYNKALDEVKDSCVLYTNRALTLIKLELPKKSLEDSEKALRLNESSLKALLYKAQALSQLSQDEEANETIQQAIEKHPKHQQFILEYTASWYKED